MPRQCSAGLGADQVEKGSPRSSGLESAASTRSRSYWPFVPDPRTRRFHHVGIPTTDHRQGERHLPEFGLHVSGFEESPYRVEWMRFDPDSPLPMLVQTVAHVAFQVDDLEKELEGREVLIPPNSPSPGIRVAFIVYDGAPIEFLEISDDARI